MMSEPRIYLLHGDITKIPVDAIVNAANSSLLGGGGVDGAIHRAGGSAILEECRSIRARQGGCAPGQAVITTAGRLPTKYVIHTVGPVWNGGIQNEDTLLADCYRNSLQLAADKLLESIAFPNISTGIYRFPKQRAAAIALDSVLLFFQKETSLKSCSFVCFDAENFEIYKAYCREKNISIIIYTE